MITTSSRPFPEMLWLLSSAAMSMAITALLQT